MKVDVSTIYGVKTRQPLVLIGFLEDDKTPAIAYQMAPDEARNVAHMLVEAAETAEQDAFIVHFAIDEMDASPEIAATLLTKFRKYRDA